MAEARTRRRPTASRRPRRPPDGGALSPTRRGGGCSSRPSPVFSEAGCGRVRGLLAGAAFAGIMDPGPDSFVDSSRATARELLPIPMSEGFYGLLAGAGCSGSSQSQRRRGRRRRAQEAWLCEGVAMRGRGCAQRAGWWRAGSSAVRVALDRAGGSGAALGMRLRPSAVAAFRHGSPGSVDGAPGR